MSTNNGVTVTQRLGNSYSTLNQPLFNGYSTVDQRLGMGLKKSLAYRRAYGAISIYIGIGHRQRHMQRHRGIIT